MRLEQIETEGYTPQLFLRKVYETIQGRIIEDKTFIQRIKSIKERRNDPYVYTSSKLYVPKNNAENYLIVLEENKNKEPESIRLLFFNSEKQEYFSTRIVLKQKYESYLQRGLNPYLNLNSISINNIDINPNFDFKNDIKNLERILKKQIFTPEDLTSIIKNLF